MVARLRKFATAENGLVTVEWVALASADSADGSGAGVVFSAGAGFSLATAAGGF